MNTEIFKGYFYAAAAMSLWMLADFVVDAVERIFL
jgi:hypothetical protein